MKLTIPLQKLLAALETVAGVAPARSGISPILCNVLVEAKSESLFLTATDLETCVRRSVAAAVEGYGALCVPAKAFLAIARTLPDGEVSLRKDGFTLHVEVGEIHCELVGMDVSDFPVAPAPEGGKPHVTADQAEFRRLLLQTEFSASNDQMNGVLNSVHVVAAPGTLTAVSCDRRRVARAVIKGDVLHPGHFTLPLRTVAFLRRECGDSGRVRITFNDRRAFFVVELGVSDTQPTPTGILEVASKLIAEKYPDYEQVLPNKAGVRIRVQVGALADAIERARLVADKTNVGTLFNLQKGRLGLLTETDRGRAEESVAAQDAAKPFKSRLNPGMVGEALQVIAAPEVTLEFAPESKQPFRFSTDGFLYLLMPMTETERGAAPTPA